MIQRCQRFFKNGFEATEHEFPFETSPLVKQDYLFRCSVAPGNFPLERPRVVFHLLGNQIFS